MLSFDIRILSHPFEVEFHSIIWLSRKQILFAKMRWEGRLKIRWIRDLLARGWLAWKSGEIWLANLGLPGDEICLICSVFGSSAGCWIAEDCLRLIVKVYQRLDRDPLLPFVTNHLGTQNHIRGHELGLDVCDTVLEWCVSSTLRSYFKIYGKCVEDDISMLAEPLW